MIEILMPDKNEGLRAERGQRFAAWLKSVAVNPITGEVMTPTEIAKLVGVRPSMARVWLSDCFDDTEERYKLPGEANIDRLAEKLNVDPNEGREAAGRPRKSPSTPTPGSPNWERIALPSGDIVWVETAPGTRMLIEQKHRQLIQSAFEVIPKVKDSA